MRPYHQLTREQRYQISALMKMDHKQSEIAQVIGVHSSSVSREVRRNSGGRGYRPKQADEKALARQAKAKPRITAATWKVVEAELREDWSPEQISGRLKKCQGICISPEWIYQHILADQRAGGDLHTHLRCQKRYHKRSGKVDSRGKLAERVSIEARPAAVEPRQRLGDWEADTLIGQGHNGALVSLVERKSRFTLIWPVKQRLAEWVSQATITLLHPFADRVLTITSDNGKEFADHVHIAQALQAAFYFAHPYSSWERGTNENTNGLIRQYFPKKTDFSKVVFTEALTVMDKLNLRPRKCLDFLTPFEVFFEHQSVALTT